jgi:hypothetical protein
VLQVRDDSISDPADFHSGSLFWLWDLTIKGSNYSITDNNGSVLLLDKAGPAAGKVLQLGLGVSYYLARLALLLDKLDLLALA